MKTPAGFAWKDPETGQRYKFAAGDDVPADIAAQVDWLNAQPEPEPEPDGPDWSGMKKAELVEAAEAAGLDTSGTKADLVERLTGAS